MLHFGWINFYHTGNKNAGILSTEKNCFNIQQSKSSKLKFARTSELK